MDQLVQAQNQTVRLARNTLDDSFSRLPADPYAARDVLLRTVPALVDEFGAIAESVAAEWFSDVYGLRASNASATFGAERIEGTVRRTAAGLFVEDRSTTLLGVASKMDKWVKYSGRNAVAESASRHSLRFARVPSGAETCDWCLMLASRGAVYTSADAAASDYHTDCDCMPVPADGPDDYPSGYDPDALYQRYLDGDLGVF